MTKRSVTSILLVCAALGVACGWDGFEPKPLVLNTLVVTPNDATLSTVAPKNTLQLNVVAYEHAGAPLQRTGAATYSSSAPAIARVSRSGVVTSVAPGFAEITAALTLGGTTRTASMTVTVYAIDFSDIAGVYDLTALVQSFDPAWGDDLTGYRYTAVLTLPESGGPSELAGTFADLLLIGPGGDTTYIAATGSVTASSDFRGRLVLELAHDQNPPFHLTLVVATLSSGFIDGDFGHAHIGGPFTATRRAPASALLARHSMIVVAPAPQRTELPGHGPLIP